MKRTLATLAASLAAIGIAHADTYTLTFDAATACSATTACNDWGTILQSHGDVAGVVDVSYIDARTTGQGLYWWGPGYNSLPGVAFATGGDGSSHARIELKALNGGNVSLQSMDFAAYYPNLGTHIRVTTIGGGDTLFSYDGGINKTGSLNTFTPNVSAHNGLWIDWYNSAYNVGINNVRFSVTAVPEPESYAMLLAGLGLIGAIARRRARRA